jgi:DNA-damage-inducible protein J
MDKDIKEQADFLFNTLGFNLTTAVNTFVRQCLRERAIPFQIRAYDDYYNDYNMRRLLESKQQIAEGNFVVKTIEELEALVNE